MPRTYPAITLWEPWATLIARGWKTIETRTHPRLCRLQGQRIAIHAGKSFDHEALYYFYRAYGPNHPILEVANTKCSPGTVVALADVVKARRLAPADSAAACCSCSTSLFGLDLANIVPFPEPIPARGGQGIWLWTDGLADDDLLAAMTNGSPDHYELDGMRIWWMNGCEAVAAPSIDVARAHLLSCYSSPSDKDVPNPEDCFTVDCGDPMPLSTPVNDLDAQFFPPVLAGLLLQHHIDTHGKTPFVIIACRGI